MKMTDNYIAGFFDGEGSAIILTIKRNYQKRGISFQFRPQITIAQNSREVLDRIVDHLGYGDIQKNNTNVHKFVTKNNKSILDFCHRMKGIVYVKTAQLKLLIKFCNSMKNMKGQTPYSRQEFLMLLEMRDEIHTLNNKSRKNPDLKYSKEYILANHSFVDDIKDWQSNRESSRIESIRTHFKNKRNAKN